MKKRAISFFLVISMSFTFLYPNLSLNDNVLECTKEEDSKDKTVYIDGYEVSVTDLMRAPRSEKKFKLKLLEWFNEICG